MQRETGSPGIYMQILHNK